MDTCGHVDQAMCDDEKRQTQHQEENIVSDVIQISVGEAIVLRHDGVSRLNRVIKNESSHTCAARQRILPNTLRPC